MTEEWLRNLLGDKSISDEERFRALLKGVIDHDPVGFAVSFCQEFHREELAALMQQRSLSIGEAALILLGK